MTMNTERRAPGQRQHWALRYGTALAFTLLALALNFLPPAAENLPFVFFFGAVAISAWACSFGPAIFSTAIAAVSADYFFLAPQFAWSISPGDFVRILFFVAVALIISSIARQKEQAEPNGCKERSRA